jgi:transposase
MKNKEFIGIDVSKNVLDIFIFSLQFHFIIENAPSGFAKLLETCYGMIKNREDIFFCFEKLKQLLRLRDKLIKHRTAYKNAINDLQDCFIEGETLFIRKTQERLMEQLNQEIKAIENRINSIIQSIPQWNINYQLIQTIKGIGPILDKYLIIYTENFTLFDDPRKLACFVGIAPFEYSSGSSVKGRTRVHPFANKHLKSLLNMAATFFR